MENYVCVNGIKIWTDIRGEQNNKFLILCNGGPGCCDYLSPVSEMLEDKYTVIRFEQRGCGRSDKDGQYDLETAIFDLEEIRKFYGIECWIVAGHSWGANLALIYAMMYPKRAEAILYIAGNGLQRNREWSTEYHANREKYGEIMPNMKYEGNDEVNKAGNISYQKFIQRPSLWKDISNLKTETIFICAENDIRPNWPTQQIYELLPNSQIAIIENATHYIWLTHYNELKQVLRNFLDRVSITK